MEERGLARRNEISTGISQDTKQGIMVQRNVNGILTDKLLQSIDNPDTEKAPTRFNITQRKLTSKICSNHGGGNELLSCASTASNVALLYL